MSDKDKLLGHEETLALISAAQNDDEQAMDLLVEHNIALVRSIVKKYAGRGAEYDDLFQTGCLGLIKAIKNYDSSFGVRFSTYAVPMIAGEIKRYLRDDGMIKVSRSIKELGIRAISIRERISNETGRDASIEEIARELECEPIEIANALEALKPHISIYDPIYDDGDGTQTLIADRLSDSDNTSEEVIDRIFLKEILTALPPRDRQIIFMRYFMNKTQTEVAKTLGISQVQVSRLESKIISRLRNEYGNVG